MKILEHCDNEYYIIMRADTDMDSLEGGLDKLIEDEDDNPDGIITDWEDTGFEQVLSTMSSAFKNPGKELHIYIGVENDTEESWKRIGNTIGMSLEDLHHAKKLITKVYRAYIERNWNEDYTPTKEDLQGITDAKARGLSIVPRTSLWNTPWPGTKPVPDFGHGEVALGRLDQLRYDNENFLDCGWMEDVLLFHLDGEEDISDLLQEIENLLMMTEEAQHV